MEKRYLYLMLSKTDTGVGRIIRTVSRFALNHVSMTLDPSFRNWVSFAHYAQDTTLYGGFVREPAERFLAKGYDVRVRIFRLEITEEKHRQLVQPFARAGQRDGVLLYNLFDAAASAFRKKVEIPGSYTCLSFACAVLGTRYQTIEELNDALSDRLYYDGPLAAVAPDSGDRSDSYFTNLGLVRGLRSSAGNVRVLLRRMLCPQSFDPGCYTL